MAFSHGRHLGRPRHQAWSHDARPFSTRARLLLAIGAVIAVLAFLMLMAALAGAQSAAPDSLDRAGAPAAPAIEAPAAAAPAAATATPPATAPARAAPAVTATAASAPAPARPVAPAPARRPAAAPAPPSPPADLADLDGWLDYKLRSHIATLPQEARLFYRHGLLLRQSGSNEEAVRLVRGATELDPWFVSPHLTLASWFLLREPGQALFQYAGALELARQNFALQLALAANAAVLGFQALYLAVLAAALMLVALRHAELMHVWRERLALYASGETARWWVWGFLVLPFMLGLGLALPAAVLLGMLWPVLKGRERAAWVLLVLMIGGTPWALEGLGRLASAMREDAPPLYGVQMVENQPYSRSDDQRLARLAAAHPDDAFLHFGHAWLARRGGDVVAAERAYRRALELWPQNDRVCNNLGNTLAMQGRAEEALGLYLRATRIAPGNAAAWFNASQIYTQRFQYHEATQALARASALNFDLVKSYQSQATDDGLMPLADQWIAPATFWRALTTAPTAAGELAVPPAWRGHLETSGWRYSLLAVAVALAALVFGLVQHHALPMRTCSNCGTVVCRRCARRRREQALCPTCASIEARAESPEFARVLLLQHRRRIQAPRHLARTALASLVPGYGLLACRRVVTPMLLLFVAAALGGGALGLDAPFSYEPRVALPEPAAPIAIQVGLWLLVYLVSIASYFSHVARVQAQEDALAAPVRSRSVQSTRRSTAEAA